MKTVVRGIMRSLLPFLVIGLWLYVPFEAQADWQIDSLQQWTAAGLNCESKGTAYWSICGDYGCDSTCSLDYLYVQWSGCCAATLKICVEGSYQCGEGSDECWVDPDHPGVPSGTSWTWSGYNVHSCTDDDHPDYWSIGVCVNIPGVCVGYHSGYSIVCEQCP